MPSHLHHAAVATTEPERLERFLVQILGLAAGGTIVSDGTVANRILGWATTEPVEARMFGKGTSGLVEVIRIPPALREHVVPGVPVLSFATPDLERRIELAAHFGADVSEPVAVENEYVSLVAAVAQLDGLRIELVRFVGDR